LKMEEHHYLGSGILASNTIGAELEVRLSALNVLVVGIIQMTVDDLLGKGQRLVQSVVRSGRERKKKQSPITGDNRDSHEIMEGVEGFKERRSGWLIPRREI